MEGRIRQNVNELLDSTGERDKLKKYIEDKLQANGWNDKVKLACKDFIKGKGVDNVSVDDVVNGVAATARNTIPKDLGASVMEKIRKFIEENKIGQEEETEDEEKKTENG